MKELQLPDGRKLLLPVLPMETKIKIEPYYAPPILSMLCDEANHKVIEFFDSDCSTFTILGPIHYENGAYVFGFDPTPFVEKVAHIGKYVFWMNYMFTQPIYAGNTCGTPEDSFLSLLNKKADVWFVNPLGEEPNPEDYYSYERMRYDDCGGERVHNTDHYRTDLAAWRSAEEKVVRGKLLVILKG